MNAANAAGKAASKVPASVVANETVILSHLPLKTSRAYFRLRAAAGSPTGVILPMTKAEVWTVPAERLGEVNKAAQALGVGVAVIGAGSDHALAPMDEKVEMSAAQKNMMHDAMSDKAAMGMAMMSLPEPQLLEYLLTAGGADANRDGPGPAIVLSLNDATSLTARRTSVVMRGDHYEWHGIVEGTNDPVTLLWWPSGRLTGTVKSGNSIFSLHSMGNGLQGVLQLAPKMLPPEHAPMDQGKKTKMNMTEDPLVKSGDAGLLMMDKAGGAGIGTNGQTNSKWGGDNLENLQDLPPAAAKHEPKDWLDMARHGPKRSRGEEVVITLIVATTKAAASHYTDIASDLVALAVAEANQSFVNSGIGNVRIEVAKQYQTDYVEDGTHFDHVFKFAEKGDGVMDEIQGLRDKAKADIAVLVVDDANGCGLSAGVAPPAERAFIVVHHACAAVSYSLAHEIGHIIGARHDAGLDATMVPFAYGHGYVNGTKWRTMMSYEQSCDGCPRLPIWSSPGVSVNGEAAGGPMANNARVIAEGAKRVASFR